MKNYYSLFLNKVNIKRKNFFIYNSKSKQFIELKPSKVVKDKK